MPVWFFKLSKTRNPQSRTKPQSYLTAAKHTSGVVGNKSTRLRHTINCTGQRAFSDPSCTLSIGDPIIRTQERNTGIQPKTWTIRNIRLCFFFILDAPGATVIYIMPAMEWKSLANVHNGELLSLRYSGLPVSPPRVRIATYKLHSDHKHGLETEAPAAVHK